MTEALRKGWCPGALRPMMARDGLLVRLRIGSGQLDAAAARAIAALAEYYGNGLLDLSARANLQLRGVAEADLAALLDGLADLGLIDTDPAGEAVRNVMASPLAGLDGGFDIGPIVASLEARLVADTTLHALPGKFGFLVDDGGEPSLAGVAADVRFDLIRDEQAPCVWIGLGGTRDRAVPIGICAPENIVEAAAWIATRFLSLAAEGQPAIRRMAALIDRLGAPKTARAFGCETIVDRLGYTGAFLDRPPVGMRRYGEMAVLGLAAPFGRLDHTMLRAAADFAEAHALGQVRLTPWRCLLVPGVRDDGPTASLHEAGFIVDPDDSVLRIAACVGRDGCERGTTPTHADARALRGLAERSGGGIVLHVSGCEKGCAKPTRTHLTLVGRDGLYDVVRGGLASDPPGMRGLDLAAIGGLRQPT